MPGYTTPTEFQLVFAATQAIAAQMNALVAVSKEIVAGAKCSRPRIERTNMLTDAKTSKAESWSIDELLEKQSQTASAATIEAVSGQPDLVKVTPWVADSGCLCHLAIEVQKSSIKSVTPTGQKHNCCGKILSVVEVKFNDKSQMTLSEIFGQLGAKAASREGHAHGPAHAAVGYSAPASLPRAFNTPDSAGCHWQWVCPPTPPPPPPVVGSCQSTCDGNLARCYARQDGSDCECYYLNCLASCNGRPQRRCLD